MSDNDNMSLYLRNVLLEVLEQEEAYGRELEIAGRDCYNKATAAINAAEAVKKLEISCESAGVKMRKDARSIKKQLTDLLEAIDKLKEDRRKGVELKQEMESKLMELRTHMENTRSAASTAMNLRRAVDRNMAEASGNAEEAIEEYENEQV